MADYYSILARAVSGLTNNNAQARQELYEHAREFLIAQLRREDVSALGIIGEQVVLETAILRLESKWRSISERGPETLRSRLGALIKLHKKTKEPTSETVLDFASLLREPAW